MRHLCGTLSGVIVSSPGGEPAARLRDAKHQLVRDAITDAAIALFASKGFEDTTVEDIANAAGVSRRSFFRYFASKNDVMAEPFVAYGRLLVEAIGAAPRTYSPFEVVRDAVLRIATAAAAYPRTRETMQIVRTSAAARQAQLSRHAELSDRITQAFADRFAGDSAGRTAPRLLASVTLSVLDTTFQIWFDGGTGDVCETADEVMATLGHLVCGNEPGGARLSSRK